MHRTIEQLSAYSDGDLDPAERQFTALHLAECAECRESYDRMLAVKSWAPRYEGLPPSRDLWPAIASALTPEAAPRRKPGAWRGRRVTVPLPLLAAAAVLLVVVGGLLARTSRAPAPAPAAGAPGPVRYWNADRAQATDAEYDAAITELEAILATSDTTLEPGTLAVIRESLADIDTAIAEARQAIARDSSNTYLNASIAQYMRRKLGILRKAAQAATASS